MDKFVLYLKESYHELIEKVTWPTRENLIDSAQVVVFSALLLSLMIFGMDFIVNQVLSFVYSL